MDSLKKPLLSLYRAFNNNLKALEALQVPDPSDPLPFPVVFILGAPRSGTTLIYQSLITAFNFSYFSNTHCGLFGAPWLIEKILKPSDKFHQSSFRSRFGFVNGWNAPSECGDFWYRFFPRHPQYVSWKDTNPEKMTELRAAMHTFQKASGKPLLIKNLPCALRLEPLRDILPEAIFLVVCRNETDTAHSILESRKRMYGSYDRWFSLEPPTLDQLKDLSAPGQVVGQIRAVYKEIRRAEQEDNLHRFMNIRYEEFCINPNKKLEETLSFFNEHDLNLTRRRSVPESFEQRKEVTIDRDLYDELLQYVKNNPRDE